MVSLTRQQARVLEFIGEHLSRVGRPPTLREIAGAFMMASTNGANCHLRALERKGYIERNAHAARGIRLTASVTMPPGTAPLGRVAATPPESCRVSVARSLRRRRSRSLPRRPRSYNKAAGALTHHRFVARNDMAKERYEEKFREFIKLIAEARRQGTPTVIVQRPEVLGDTYEEIIESLNRLAAAGLTLTIVPPSERTDSKDSFRWS